MTKRFSDFATERIFLDGDKLKIQDVLNKEIELISFKITNSKYNKNNSGKCLELQFSFPNNNDRYVIFTGSDVLIAQTKQYEKELPFTTTIVQINKFYTFR